MKRRDFLQTTAAGCVVTIASPVSALAIEDTAPQPSSPPPAFELDEWTFSQLQQAMTSGRYSSKQLVEKYSDRIGDINKKGPAINAVIEMNPDAERIAAELDRERKEKGPRGPLHGIPVLIKDNLDTADRMMTTAGSLALVGAKPARDSYVAKKLREAGAVILGKTNLSEWANFRSTKSSSGWSGRGGQTKNPYVLDRNPCGSSSGSGAAAAANLCAATIGTETDGSIVCPSSANSLVGIKPTVGKVSGAGIIPIAHSQDTAGPMARTVADAWILFASITEPVLRSAELPKEVNMKGLRLGVARKHFGFNERVDKLMEECLAELKKLGVVLVDPADIPTSGKFDDSEFEVLLYEFKADLNAYLAGLGPSAPVRSLKDIIDFNEKNRDREMPYFGQDIMIKAQAKGPLTSKPYLDALRKNHLLTRSQGIDFVLKKNRLAALVAPTGGPPWPTDWVNGDHFAGGYSSASAVAGYPHITVPAGYVFGLPVGISFFGGANSEPLLAQIAWAFEQATKARKPPKFLETADFS